MPLSSWFWGSVGTRIFWAKNGTAPYQEWFGTVEKAGSVPAGETAFDTDRFSLTVRNGNNTNFRTMRGASPTPGSWYHIAQTYDGVTNTLTLYVNGAVSNVYTFSSGSRAGNLAGPLSIGGLSVSAINSWHGCMSLVSFTNSVVSAGRIAAHASSTSRSGYVAEVSADLVSGASNSALWEMQELSGSIVDSIGAKNGSPVFTTPIRYGRNGPFAGSKSIEFPGNAYFSIADDNLWSSSSFTIEGWVMAGPGSAYSQLVLADNPSLFWPLNETSGTTVYDITANGNNGVYQGTPVLGGQSGALSNSDPTDKAAYFDGIGVLSTTFDSVTRSANPVGTTTGSDFTYEWWVKPDSDWLNYNVKSGVANHYVTLFQVWNRVGPSVNTTGFLRVGLTTSNTPAPYLKPVGQRLYVYLGTGVSTYSTILAYDERVILAGAWNHCVIRRSGNQISLFVNGVLLTTTADQDGAGAGTAGATYYTSTQAIAAGQLNIAGDWIGEGLNLAVGSSDTTVREAEHFKGQMALFAAYPTALPLATIQTRYGTGGGFTSPPVDPSEGWSTPDSSFVAIPPDPADGTADPAVTFTTIPVDPADGTADTSQDFVGVPPDPSEGMTIINLSFGGVPNDPTEGWAETGPKISTLLPSEGPIAGGTTVVVTGFNFTGVTGVTFGGVAGTIVPGGDDNTITVVSPSTLAGGPVHVVVTGPLGSTQPLPADLFNYFAPLTISEIDPIGGSIDGNTSVEISGTGFTGTLASNVKFDTSSVTSIVVNSDSLMTVTTPAHAVGLVNIVITNRTTVTAVNAFRYFAPPTVTSLDVGDGPGVDIRGPVAGGTRVSPSGLLTIIGTGFTSPVTVSFDGGTPISVSPVTSTQIDVLPPAHVASLGINISVTTNAGTASTTGLPYRYYAPLSVASVTPPFGARAGGTSVTITGTGFLNASSVEFDGVAVTSFNVVSDTSITTTTPGPHASGAVVVGVETDLE